VTDPRVGFFLGGERVPLGEGECWYMDFNLPHRVENDGDAARVHLVVDCVVNEWVRSLFPSEWELPAPRALFVSEEDGEPV
jgi:quercetin dioxygenase-like cupin family protein